MGIGGRLVRVREHRPGVTLRTVPVPNPPAGADWQTTVPGQYLYAVTGITATLSTPNAWPTMHDSSGNHYDGTYVSSDHSVGAADLSRPGAVTGNNSVNVEPVSSTGIITMTVIRAMAINCSHDFTFEFWVRQTAGSNVSVIADVQDTISPFITVAIEPDGSIAMVRRGIENYITAAAAFPFDDDFHLVSVCFSFTGTYVCCVDGVSQTIATTTPPGSRGIAPTSVHEIDFGRSPNADVQGWDEVALYPVVLSAGQCAARYASRSSAAGYAAGVIGDGAQAYYRLDEVAPGTGRQVVLQITNGQLILEEIPTGFADLTSPGPYSYSWDPNLNSSTQVPTTELTTVAIPQLILPAGYTIGTVTLDISPADQWSDITVWWDDTIMDSLSPIDVYAYPPGALLVYQQIKANP